MATSEGAREFHSKEVILASSKRGAIGPMWDKARRVSVESTVSGYEATTTGIAAGGVTQDEREQRGCPSRVETKVRDFPQGNLCQSGDCHLSE